MFKITCARCGTAVVSDRLLTPLLLQDYWHWPEYKNWVTLAESQNRPSEYFDRILSDMELARRNNGVEGVQAVLAYHLKGLYDAEQDAA